MFLDESHQTVPQLHGMFHGDRSRKEVLVGHGFRLPSALDNRPLTFEEFENRVNQIVYVSATPGSYELTKSAGVVVEQIIRPTGLVDPEIEIRPIKGQVDDLLGEIRKREVNGPARSGDYADEAHGRRSCGILFRDRCEVQLSALGGEHARPREDPARSSTRRVRRADRYQSSARGLDLPEVSLVAILDADKEGFLRSTGALIQTIGRAARHLEGRAILYADVMTDSMKRAIDETRRRRNTQIDYNERNGITPQSIIKPIDMSLIAIAEGDYVTVPVEREDDAGELSPAQREQYIVELEERMREAAKKFEFEKAAQLRDKIKDLRLKDVAGIGIPG